MGGELKDVGPLGGAHSNLSIDLLWRSPRNQDYTDATDAAAAFDARSCAEEFESAHSRMPIIMVPALRMRGDAAGAGLGREGPSRGSAPVELGG